MRALRFVRQHPLALLGALSAAFVGWIWWDATTPREPDHTSETAGADGPARAQGPYRPVTFSPQGYSSDDRTMARLKPGMTRFEVERLVGLPAPDHVYPATVTDGRVTYRAAYETDLETLRPLRPFRYSRHRSPDATADPPVNSGLVTLEFDATQPGHPLLDVYYPDPLF